MLFKIKNTIEDVFNGYYITLKDNQANQSNFQTNILYNRKNIIQTPHSLHLFHYRPCISYV